MNFRCQMCNVFCSGLEPFQQHMVSIKHKKKENQVLALTRIQGPNNNAGFNTSNDFRDQCIGRSGDSDISTIPRPPFLEDKEHPNSVTDLCDGQIGNADAQGTGLSSLIGLQNHMSNDYFCYVCKIQCSGLEPYQQHVSGIKHKKRQNQTVLQNDLPLPNNATSTNFSDQCVVKPEAGGLSNVSQLSVFLNKENLDSSMKSSEQQVNCGAIQGAGTSQPQLDFQSQQINDYFCRVCSIACSGSYPYQQHITGEKHRKKLRQSNLSSSNVISDPVQNFPSGTFQNSPSSTIQNIPLSITRPAQNGPDTNESTSAASLPGRTYLTEEQFLQGSEEDFVPPSTISEASPICQDPILKPKLDDSSLITTDGLNVSCDNQRAEHNKIVEKHSPIQPGTTNVRQEIGAIGKSPHAEILHPVMSYSCSLCQINCTGLDQYKQHMQGKQHAKKMKLQNCTSTLTIANRPNSFLSSTGEQIVPQTPSSNPDSVLASGKENSTVLFTSKSSNTFKHPNTDEQNYDTVDAAVYAFPAKQVTSRGETDENILAINNSQHLNPMKFFCEVCSIQCTGPDPYNAHIRGKQHMKMLARKQPVHSEGDSAVPNDRQDIEQISLQLSNPADLGIFVIEEDSEISLDAF